MSRRVDRVVKTFDVVCLFIAALFIIALIADAIGTLRGLFYLALIVGAVWLWRTVGRARKAALREPIDEPPSNVGDVQ